MPVKCAWSLEQRFGLKFVKIWLALSATCPFLVFCNFGLTYVQGLPVSYIYYHLNLIAHGIQSTNLIIILYHILVKNQNYLYQLQRIFVLYKKQLTHQMPNKSHVIRVINIVQIYSTRFRLILSARRMTVMKILILLIGLVAMLSSSTFLHFK